MKLLTFIATLALLPLALPAMLVLAITGGTILYALAPVLWIIAIAYGLLWLARSMRHV